jgi:hypothetical protein
VFFYDGQSLGTCFIRNILSREYRSASSRFDSMRRMDLHAVAGSERWSNLKSELPS